MFSVHVAALHIGLFFLLVAGGMESAGNEAMALFVLSAILSMGSAVVVYRSHRHMKSRGQ
jgi:hypothetical protein